jgi:flagellar M-ring protein FliF
MSEGQGEGGVAGIVANSPDVSPAASQGASGSASTRSSETVNYEISKTVSRQVLPVGQIQKLSVAVLIDGKPIAPVSAGPEGEGESAPGFAAWNADELREFEELAKRAVGFDAERGDEISVINSPFIGLEVEEAPPGLLTPDMIVLINTLLQALGLMVGLFLFSRLFVRPLANAVSGGDNAAIADLREEVIQRLARIDVDRAQVASGEEGITMEDMDIPGLVERNDEMTVQQQVDRLAQLRAEDSVRTIRSWMATGGA